jgi:hypothetical protein
MLTQPLPRAAELRDAYLRSTRADSAAALEALLREQPDDIDAHALRIARHVVAKDLKSFPALARALHEAEPHWLRAPPELRRHAYAAKLWLRHRPLHAAHAYSMISARNPRDLLALRLAQSCWYFLGRRAKVHAVANRALQAWSPHDVGYDIVLAMTAFGCDEIGDASRAARLTALALEIEPDNPYAIHARAHALASLAPRDGVALLEQSAERWAGGSRLNSHVAWHLAVAHLGGGTTANAAATLETLLIPRAAQGASAASDATDLAWRLDLADVDVGSAWERLAKIWAGHPRPGFWPPYDLLAGMTYLRAGSTGHLNALRERLVHGPFVRRCASRAARVMTLPALDAMSAFTRGSLAAAEQLLSATIVGMEGSLLQRELFELTLRIVRRAAAPAAQTPWRMPA